MTRRLLGSDLVPPQSIRFAAQTYGKPVVMEPEEAKLPFNVAHTDGLVMCGIGDRNHELIGVDVERLDRQTDPEIADRYFSKPELQFLNTHRCPTAKRNAFLRIWTLKESFIKALGTGLQTPLADFAFEEIESDTPSIRMLNPKLESNTTWSFYSFQPRTGFIGAVAVATKIPHVRIDIELHSFDDLVT